MATSVKKNFGWNLLLMVSGYLFPMITFPYVTRVLGAEGLGLGNFVLSIVDYAVLFSTFGIATIGYRYIPQCNDDKEKRNHVFNSLVTLHLLMSAIVLIIYLGAVFLTPQLREYHSLYIVGATKIIFNVFLVEWLFEGMQDFKFITIRTIFVRLAYVLAILLLVQDSDDYDWFVLVSIGQIGLNAIVNWRYTKRYVSFRLDFCGVKEYLFPVFSMGINRILLSFYSTFLTMFLGFACSTLAVGYFTAATKLYGIFIGFISAFNGVLVPHLNSLLGQGNLSEFKQKITLSFSMVCLVSIPFTIIAIMLGPEIIRLIAGGDFEASVLPFQIISFQIVFVSLAQITENQILLSLKKFKQVLFCTLLSTILSIVIMILWVPKYGAVAAATAVALPHLVECSLLFYYAHKALDFHFPKKELCMTILVSLPIILICICTKSLVSNYIATLIIGGSISMTYYFCFQYFILKNDFLVSQVNQVLRRKQ